MASQRKFYLVSLFLGYEFEKGELSSFHPQSTEENPGFWNHQSCKKTMTLAGLDFRLCGVFPEREHIFSSLASLRRQLGFPPKLLHKNPMTPAGFHEDVCKTETLCTVCYVHTLHFQTCLMSFIQLHAVALFVITSSSRIFSLNS